MKKPSRRGLTGILLIAGCATGLGSSTAGGPSEAASRVVIDADPGTDDALAILMALSSPELRVEAITVVAGNVTAAQGLENALKLVTLAGRPDVPVAAGAARPLVQPLVTAESHGPDGMGTIALPAPRSRPHALFGPDLIAELVRRHPHEITLVTLGPLTNVALAVSRDPEVAKLVKEVVLMGGAISGGNVDAVAEFNVYVDPEAARVVFEAGWPLTMVGLEIGRKALFTREHLAALRKGRGPRNDFAADLLEYRVGLGEKDGLPGATLYDPTAMAAVVDRTLIATQPMHVDVELRGEFTRAQTVANRQNALNRKVPRGDHLVFQGTEPLPANAQVAIDIDAERFTRLLIARLSGQ